MARQKKATSTKAPSRRAAKTTAEKQPAKRARTRKAKEPEAEAAPISRRQMAINFYAGALDRIERKTKMYSNSMRYADPLSTGVLSIDRGLSGGLRNAFASIAGEEQSGKTSLCYHALASAYGADTIINSFIDAEGTLNEGYATNVFMPYGIDFMQLIKEDNSPIRYYRRNVIETVFDYIHAFLKQLPDKAWIPETNSWAYLIPKNDKHFKAVSDALELVPDKALTTESTFVCPTEYGGIEAAMFIDSLAAMVTENDDESEERSRIRAAEASAFSLHLKRVMARLSAKSVMLFGVNQLRKIPGQTYGDPLYEPGGEALKFYCLSSDEYVFTEQGLMTMGEIHSRELYKPGLVVATVRGTESSSYFGYTGEKPIAVVTTEAGRIIKTGDSHRVLAVSPHKLNPHWVKVKDLTTAHYVCSKLGAELYGDKLHIDYEIEARTKGQGSNNTSDPYEDVALPLTMTTELAELIGVLVADGYVTYRAGYYHCAITKHDSEVRSKIKTLWKKVFGIEPNETPKGLVLSSQRITGFLAHLGVANKLTQEKQVPLCIRQAPKQLQKAFLRGYLSNDSSISSDKSQWVAYSSSKYLLNEIRQMLQNMGIYATGTTNRHSHEKVKRNGISVGSTSKLYLNGNMAQRLYDELDMANGVSKLPRPVDPNPNNYRRPTFKQETRVPVLWGWHSKGLNQLLSESSAYAAKRCGKREYTTTIYWDELSEEIFSGVLEEITSDTKRTSVMDFRKTYRLTRKENLVWERVVSVELSTEKEPTYDFEIPGSHTVVAGGIVGHNSAQRLRVSSRVAPKEERRKGEDAYQGFEESVYEGRDDLYHYKAFKVTKNKMGPPKIQGSLRIWSSDSYGNVRGFDPYYDLQQYLFDTKQLIRTKQGRNAEYRFQLRDSVGAKRAKFYNQLPDFTMPELKLLVLAEVEKDRELRKSVEDMGIGPRVKLDLRHSLFEQVRNDKEVYARDLVGSSKDKDDDDDIEEI